MTPSPGHIEPPVPGVAGAGGRYRGPYAPGTAYQAQDIVTESGALYARLAQGTPAGAFVPAEWAPLSVGSGGRVTKFYGPGRDVALPAGATVGFAPPGVVKQNGLIRFFGEVTVTKTAFDAMVAAGTPLLGLPEGFEVSVLDAPVSGENSAQIYASLAGSPALFGIMAFYLYPTGLVPYVWLTEEPDWTGRTEIGFCFTQGAVFLEADPTDELPA